MRTTRTRWSCSSLGWWRWCTAPCIDRWNWGNWRNRWCRSRGTAGAPRWHRCWFPTSSRDRWGWRSWRLRGHCGGLVVPSHNESAPATGSDRIVRTPNGERAATIKTMGESGTKIATIVRGRAPWVTTLMNSWGVLMSKRAARPATTTQTPNHGQLAKRV